MPPLSFRPNKSGAHIASTSGEVDSAFAPKTEGLNSVKLKTNKVQKNNRLSIKPIGCFIA